MSFYYSAALSGTKISASLKSRSQAGILMATMNIDGRNHTERVSADGTEECLSAFWGFTISL